MIVKAGEVYKCSSKGHVRVDGRSYRIVRQQPHPLDPAIKCWLTVDTETGEERIWTADAFGRELKKASS